jgi:hypothetical protein
MKAFDKEQLWQYKTFWSMYDPRRKFAVVREFLARNLYDELKTIIGMKQAEYFADIMDANCISVAQRIIQKKEELAELEEQLAMYNKHAKKLKELY